MMGALPNLIVIGAMKAGTTSLHRYLAGHPDVAMAESKEVNFFSDQSFWRRGVDWYASHFDRGSLIRGESSPGYTSPDHPEVAERMSVVVPDVRLIFLARHPIHRAVSQYLHHRRDGTERRPLNTALLDPDGHYVARSLYKARLSPFLARFGRHRILIVPSYRLLVDRRATLRAICRWLSIDTHYSFPGVDCLHNPALVEKPTIAPYAWERLSHIFAEDVAWIRAETGDPLVHWPP